MNGCGRFVGRDCISYVRRLQYRLTATTRPTPLGYKFIAVSERMEEDLFGLQKAIN